MGDICSKNGSGAVDATATEKSSKPIDGEGSSKTKQEVPVVTVVAPDPATGESSTIKVAQKSSTSMSKEEEEEEKRDTVPSELRSNGSSAARGRATSNRVSFYEMVDCSEVLPYLMVGNLASARNKDFVSRKNIKFILNLSSSPSEELPLEGIQYESVLMEDDEETELLPHLEECFRFINKAKSGSSASNGSSKSHRHSATSSNTSPAGGRVLVHSYFGISRSSAVVLAYLMKDKGWTLRKAFDYLREKHPSAKPNEGFLLQLLRYEQALHSGQLSMTLKDFYQ